MDTASFLDAVICGDEVPEGVPSPYMIERLMKGINIRLPGKPGRVGDTKADIEERQNLGCGIVIHATTGRAKKKKSLQNTAGQLHSFTTIFAFINILKCRQFP